MRRGRTMALTFAGIALYACGTRIDLGGLVGAADSAPPALDASLCPGWAAPATMAPCDACKAGSHACQNNGCFNEYLCDIKARDCKAPGTTCETNSSPDAHE